ncbi:MAG: hypothetical protein KC643_07275, partial [Nitrospira sp.]|nr:hypothetical protein [Nitrospira sp.]
RDSYWKQRFLFVTRLARGSCCGPADACVRALPPLASTEAFMAAAVTLPRLSKGSKDINCAVTVQPIEEESPE